jgi:hypothetical protein
LNGPLFDGYVPSKAGRDFLFERGLIDRGFGWQWLTKEGVAVCVFAKVENWFDGRWRKKQQS